MASRSGHRSAEDDQFLVFSNGTFLEYPAYEKASNGFVRGPKGEKVGRAYNAEVVASEMCKDYINRYAMAFRKMGYRMIGVTANLPVQLAWSRKQSWTWTNKSPGNIHVYAKCYFAEHPDAYEVFSFHREISGGRGRFWIQNVCLQYSLPVAYDKEGDIKEYHGTNTITQYREFHNTGWTSQREAMAEFLKWLGRYQEAFAHQYTRVEWSVEDVDALLAKGEEYLEAKDSIQELTALLPRLAELYSELGYDVDTVWASDGRDDNQAETLRITANNHSVVLSADPRVICHFERDEERLLRLQKLRLQEELHASVKAHGDVRELDESDDDQAQ